MGKAMNCKTCKHIKQITGNKKARCFRHGMSVLVKRFMEVSDREKLKAIKLEMRFK